MSGWHVLAASVDLVHAALMVLWIVSIPLLFYRRHPGVTRVCAVYAIGFIAAYQASRWALDECFLTTLARACWSRAPEAPAGGATDEWFTVRIAEAIFALSPSRGSITTVGQVLVLVTAVGALHSLFSHAPRRRARPT